MFKESSLIDGDKIFIFTEFPYDFRTLPLPIVEGVDLIYTPREHELYPREEKDKPYRYLNPLSNIPSLGIKNVCMRISSKVKNQDELFWQIMLVLRLIKPLYIGVSGSFKYTKDNKCNEPSLYWIFSRINGENAKAELQQNETYTAEDFKVAAKILNKMRISIKHFNRIKLACASFTQITSGQSTSYSMLYNELFACLETLFGSPYSGSRLSYRVSAFLSKQTIITNFDIKNWLEQEYKNGRNDISHGNPDFWVENGKLHFLISNKRFLALLRLHEITRLCILGFTGLRYGLLRGYNDSFEQDTTFFKELKASPLFFKNQKVFGKHPSVKKKSNRKR